MKKFLIIAGIIMMPVTYADDYVVTNPNIDVEFEFKEGKPGRMIQFASSDIDCSLSLAKANVKAGFSETIHSLGEGNFDVTCMTNEAHFALSPIVETFAKIRITDEQGIAIYLDFNLYNPRAKTYLKRDNIKLNLS